MFEYMEFYTHEYMRDVCFLFLGYKDEKLRVRWFKRNGLDLGVHDEIMVKVQDYPKWGKWVFKA